jgi:endonuclease-8
MPEGDTLFRVAEVLRGVLQGSKITLATTGHNPRDAGTLDPSALVDQAVTDVEARGKHLLIHLADGSAVHSHLGMTGSWHTYLRGERWRKPARRAALAIENDAGRQVVCFTPKTLELLSATALRRHRWLSQLGPDILASSLNTDEIVRRFRALDDSPLGVAIMHQMVVSGIGNVYKSEVLFLERHNPFAPVRALSDEQLVALIERCRTLMRKNLSGRPRTTRFGRDGSRKWVYGRHGQRCFECGGEISLQRQGDLGRSTYYCQHCQCGDET